MSDAKEALKAAKRAAGERQGWDYEQGMVGRRMELAKTARGLLDEARDDMRTDFAQDVDFRKRFVQMLKDSALAGDRTSKNIVAEIYKLVGEERTLVVEFMSRHGLTSEEELRRILSEYKSAGEADTLTAIERMTTALEALLPMHEAHRGAIIRRLGGYLPVESDDFGTHNHGA